MREALLVAKREYLERIRSKAFRISTVLIPLVFAAIFGMGAFSGKMASGPRSIVVASNDPVLAESTRTELLRVPTGKDDARGGQNGMAPQLHVRGASSRDGKRSDGAESPGGVEGNRRISVVECAARASRARRDVRFSRHCGRFPRRRNAVRYWRCAGARSADEPRRGQQPGGWFAA